MSLSGTTESVSCGVRRQEGEREREGRGVIIALSPSVKSKFRKPTSKRGRTRQLVQFGRGKPTKFQEIGFLKHFPHQFTADYYTNLKMSGRKGVKGDSSQLGFNKWRRAGPKVIVSNCVQLCVRAITAPSSLFMCIAVQSVPRGAPDFDIAVHGLVPILLGTKLYGGLQDRRCRESSVSCRFTILQIGRMKGSN